MCARWRGRSAPDPPPPAGAGALACVFACVCVCMYVCVCVCVVVAAVAWGRRTRTKGAVALWPRLPPAAGSPAGCAPPLWPAGWPPPRRHPPHPASCCGEGGGGQGAHARVELHPPATPPGSGLAPRSPLPRAAAAALLHPAKHPPLTPPATPPPPQAHTRARLSSSVTRLRSSCSESISPATGLPARRSSFTMRARSRQSMPLASASRTAFSAASTASRLYSIRAACGRGGGVLVCGVWKCVGVRWSRGTGCVRWRGSGGMAGAGDALEGAGAQRHDARVGRGSAAWRCTGCGALPCPALGPLHPLPTLSSAASASWPRLPSRFSWSRRIASSLPTAAFSLAACWWALRWPWICGGGGQGGRWGGACWGWQRGMVHACGTPANNIGRCTASHSCARTGCPLPSPILPPCPPTHTATHLSEELGQRGVKGGEAQGGLGLVLDQQQRLELIIYARRCRSAAIAAILLACRWCWRCCCYCCYCCCCCCCCWLGEDEALWRRGAVLASIQPRLPLPHPSQQRRRLQRRQRRGGGLPLRLQAGQQHAVFGCEGPVGHQVRQAAWQGRVGGVEEREMVGGTRQAVDPGGSRRRQVHIRPACQAHAWRGSGMPGVTRAAAWRRTLERRLWGRPCQCRLQRLGAQRLAQADGLDGVGVAGHDGHALGVVPARERRHARGRSGGCGWSGKPFSSAIKDRQK